MIGLAVMGQNLVLNFQENAYQVSVYNRTYAKTKEFEASNPFPEKLIASKDIPSFVASLEQPRKILLMVKAGDAVDAFIDQLRPHLSPGDIIIDGGNSHYEETQRRLDALASEGFSYIGLGISGGEEGARHGPSLMPGGDQMAWEEVKQMFESVAAQVDGLPCCTFLGKGGAGHFVKMVHNGIEYADMQLIAEVYQILKELGKMSHDEMAKVFDQWNQKELKSYLIEITRDILSHKEEGKAPLDYIMDVAGQKGTGRWTVASALELGAPISAISEAVFARFISSIKEERIFASKQLTHTARGAIPCASELSTWAFQALYAAKIVSYAQGFDLIRRANLHFSWDIPLAQSALIWRGGCIIRSQFLNDIAKAYQKEEGLLNLMLDDFFKKSLLACQESWRKLLSLGISQGIPLPAMSACLAYFDSYRQPESSAKLIQAQRDYFGAHTYERTDRPRGEFFHTDWAMIKEKSTTH